MTSRFALAATIVPALMGALVAAPAFAQVPPVTPGFPNVAQVPGTLLSGINAPQQGRTAILAYHNGLLFSVPEIPASQPNSDFQVRTWSLANPSAPVQLSSWGVTPQPINAHGYFASGNYLVLGANWPPEAPWSFQASGSQGVVRTTYPDLLCAGTRGCLFGPWFVGETWWSYGEITGTASISRNWQEFSNWDHLAMTGVVGHPFLLGDLLIFASDQSRTGVATYDVSNPANPVLLDVLTTGGPGGYWPELWGSGDGRLFIVFPYQTEGNGFRVVEATDPANLRFVTDRALPGDESMYIQFQDEYAFLGSHKVDMRTYESVLDLDGANTVRTNDGGVGLNTSQFLLPLGNLLVTGGVGPHQGMAVWAHQAAPDTRGPSVGFHIPRAGRTNYPLGAPISLLIHETLETKTIVNGTSFIVRPLGGQPLAGQITFSFDDLLTFAPTAPLLPNTTYEVVLPAGGIKDAAGNGMVGYSFTFSTGGSVAGNAPPAVTSFDASAYPVAPGASATLTASATEPNGGALEYRFDFGDGSAKTAWSASTAANHAWAEAGHYRATVQARDPQGALASAAVTVTVATSPAGTAPTRSSPVVLDVSSRRLWSVNPDADTVTAVDADALTVELEVPVCAEPRSVARSGNGQIWVACAEGDRVQVLDGTSGAFVADIPTGYGSSPFGVVFNPAGTFAFVTLQGAGRLLKIDAGSRAVVGTLNLGPRPRALAVSGNGSRVLVTRFLSPRDHAEVWEASGGAMTLTRTLRIPKFGGEQNRDGTAAGRGTLNFLTGIAIAPDGLSAWVTGTKPNFERGLLTANDLDTDNTVRSVVAQIDLGTNTWRQAVDLDNSDSPSAVAFSPLGDYLFVTLQGNDEMVVLDTLVSGAAGLGNFVTRLGTGAAPQGLVIDPTTRRTVAHNFLGRSLTALETDALFRRGEKSVAGTAIPTVVGEPLPATIFLGKRLFYHASDPRMSAEGYLSCATCHVDGGHDGRTWDFTGRGEGLRNTTDLRGRSGTAHGNVHWSANFDEIQDFENDIRLAFGGSGFLTDQEFEDTRPPLGPIKAGRSPELDALAAYVSSLDNGHLPKSPWRNSDGTLSAEGVAGRAIFTAQGCATCHAGPRFTDSAVGPGVLRDLGTLRTTSGGRLGGPLTGIDTPTLLGVWDTDPYFHDGSAPTLDEVFRVAGGTVVAAEAGVPSGGAEIVTQYVDLNNDDTVRGRSYGGLNSTSARITLTGVDGGAGGVGALEFRASAYRTMEVRATVNGVAYTVTVPDPGNDPQWRHTNWRTIRVEGVAWNAGAANTVVLSCPDPFPNMSVDEILVSTAADLARAEPHRRVQTISAGDRAALLAYLRQLDGTPEENFNPAVFADGFDSGSTGAWSTHVP